jgi:hypothetical protein
MSDGFHNKGTHIYGFPFLIHKTMKTPAWWMRYIEFGGSPIGIPDNCKRYPISELFSKRLSQGLYEVFRTESIFVTPRGKFYVRASWITVYKVKIREL